MMDLSPMAGTLKITDLTFVAGARYGSAPLRLRPGNVTVLVGPNNSGKSLVLREIENWYKDDNFGGKVIKSALADWPTDPDQAEQLARALETAPPPNSNVPPGHIWVRLPSFQNPAQNPSGLYSAAVNLDQLRRAVSESITGVLHNMLGPLYVVRLDGRSRFLLTDPKPSGDLQEGAENP